MKKLFLFVLPFISAVLNAEELRFVTVLSSPVGTFNRLEEVDPTVPVKSPVINFCTKLGNSGTVTLQGNKNPEVNTLSLSNGTILGGSGKDYVLNKLTMKQGGTLKGSRLLANVMQVPNAGSMGVSENLYSNNLTVAGAKTKNLTIASGEDLSQITYVDVTDPGMVWSNEYQSDKACGTQTECAKQYLLKQRGSTTPELSGNITCTDSPAGGPGAGLDINLQITNPTWKALPTCDSVGAETGGTFEGKCTWRKHGYSYANIGAYDAVFGYPPEGCPTYNCGELKPSNLLRESYIKMINSQDAPSVCQEICNYLPQSGYYCTGGSATCSFAVQDYDTGYNCNRYTLHCRHTNEVLMIRTCVRK